MQLNNIYCAHSVENAGGIIYQKSINYLKHLKIIIKLFGILLTGIIKWNDFYNQ